MAAAPPPNSGKNHYLERLNHPSRSTPWKYFTGDEVGELNSGHFVLTPANPSFLLVVYFPKGSKGTLAVSLNGDVSRRSYVVLGFPQGSSVKLDAAERVIDLKDFFLARPEGSLNLEHRVFVQPKQLRELQVLTFQLEGVDAMTKSVTDNSPSIDVTYVALVSPTITLEHAIEEQH